MQMQANLYRSTGDSQFLAGTTVGLNLVEFSGQVSQRDPNNCWGVTRMGVQLLLAFPVCRDTPT
jgi:hypothetical protein